MKTLNEIQGDSGEDALFDENKRKFAADIERLQAGKVGSVTDNSNAMPADANQGWNVTDNGNANCTVCGRGFFVKRAGSLYCSAKCKQKAYRQRTK